jgi:hypothetical protein
MDGSVENDTSTDLSCHWAGQTRNDFVAKNVLQQFQRKSGLWGAYCGRVETTVPASSYSHPRRISENRKTR